MRGKFILNYGIELYIKETTAEKFPATALVPVKGVPSIGQAGGTVETTTSSDPVKLYIPERPDTGDMDYTCNYSAENLEAVKAVCDNTKKDILIKYPNGTGSMHSRECQTWKNEVSVGGEIESTLHTVPSIQIVEKTVAEVTALIARS